MLPSTTTSGRVSIALVVDEGCWRVRFDTKALFVCVSGDYFIRV